MLHAKKIEFNHPITKKRISFEAKLPEYFKDVLEKLDKEEELVQWKKDYKSFQQRLGITSRRNAEKLILDGKVSVNGKVIKTLGIKVNPDRDIITYNGNVVKKQEEKVYILLNKPIRICYYCKRTIWKR